MNRAPEFPYLSTTMSTTLNVHRLTPAVVPAPKRSLTWYLSWAALLLLLAGSWNGADMRPLDLIRDSGNMATYAADFFPPNFSQWKMYLSEIIVTLQIALWGTALAVLTAIPLGLLASSNITPWWVHQPVRRLMDAFRAINEMVFAMLFVVAVGLGPFAGVLALWIHTAGVLAKLFSEAVEAIDPQPVEGIRSTGASALHEIVYGVIPQVMPLWISYMLYRFESNVRSASVVGMVGAGGIGVVLWEIIRGFQYAETCAVMLIIIGFVMRIVITAVELAGFIMATQMGLGFAMFFDPQHAAQVPAVSRVLTILTTLLFLAFDGHHILLTALMDSFDKMPIGVSVPALSLRLLAEWGGHLFLWGLWLSLPVVGSLLVTNLAIGVMTRAAPQFNVFSFGFPLTLMIGFIALYLVLPLLEPAIAQIYRDGFGFISKLLIAP